MPATYRRFHLQLDSVKDADLIEYLESQANVTDTIRKALRETLVDAQA